jgi:5'-nucleotidase
MRILISNDDGIYSPGLACLAQAASEFGTVRVVAPDVERSSAGHSITSSRPLSYRRTAIQEFEAYRVNGTPADCVALGAHLWNGVDVVLSGLNIGLNLGHAIWHSGTLAAAKQAALLGVRGIALSAPSGVEPDYEPYGAWIRRVLEVLLPARDITLVNVNFPRAPRGLVWTRASVEQYDGRIAPAHDPVGRLIYWFTVTPLTEADEGTDRWAVEQNWVSLTPLKLDLTDEAQLRHRRAQQPLDEAVAAAVSPPVSSAEAAATVREDEATSPLAGQVADDQAAPIGRS